MQSLEYFSGRSWWVLCAKTVVKWSSENPELRTYCHATSMSKVGTKKVAVDVEIKSRNL